MSLLQFIVLAGTIFALIPSTPLSEQLIPLQPPVPIVWEQELPDIFSAIAFCESGNRQYLNGEVIRSHTNDVGRYQINLKAHGERAEELGIDIYTAEGNEKFAMLLYREQGTAPWDFSKSCWGS